MTLAPTVPLPTSPSLSVQALLFEPQDLPAVQLRLPTFSGGGADLYDSKLTSKMTLKKIRVAMTENFVVDDLLKLSGKTSFVCLVLKHTSQGLELTEGEVENKSKAEST